MDFNAFLSNVSSMLRRRNVAIVTAAPDTIGATVAYAAAVAHSVMCKHAPMWVLDCDPLAIIDDSGHGDIDIAAFRRVFEAAHNDDSPVIIHVAYDNVDGVLEELDRLGIHYSIFDAALSYDEIASYHAEQTYADVPDSYVEARSAWLRCPLRSRGVYTISGAGDVVPVVPPCFHGRLEVTMAAYNDGLLIPDRVHIDVVTDVEDLDEPAAGGIAIGEVLTSIEASTLVRLGGGLASFSAIGQPVITVKYDQFTQKLNFYKSWI